MAWAESNTSLLNKRVRVVWNREVGNKYDGRVSEYNLGSKRYKVEFDDGDIRWYKMERKIFDLEEGDEVVSFHGQMQIKGAQLTPLTANKPEETNVGVADFAPHEATAIERSSLMKGKSPLKGKGGKTKKTKKNKKEILVRTHMVGTYNSSQLTIEGHWDESKQRVENPAKRDESKTFCYHRTSPPATVALKDPVDGASGAEDESSADEEETFIGGNCSGWFSALMAGNGKGETGYQRFSDKMMIRIYPHEGESDEDESANDVLMDVHALGGNAVGVYRVYGRISNSQKNNCTLVREYISPGQFEQEKRKFNAELLGENSQLACRSQEIHEKIVEVVSDSPKTATNTKGRRK
jgi:hypothetical protein